VTGYVILKQVEGSGDFQVVGSEEAHSDRGAIRNYLVNLDPATSSGTYVAVPQRSWRPVPVKVETTVQLRLTPSD
jgi:hypothetical protein